MDYAAKLTMNRRTQFPSLRNPWNFGVKPGDEQGQLAERLRVKKKWQTEHRTATTAYPCYLPVLGEFSRSWSCWLATAKIQCFAQISASIKIFL